MRSPAFVIYGKDITVEPFDNEDEANVFARSLKEGAVVTTDREGNSGVVEVKTIETDDVRLTFGKARMDLVAIENTEEDTTCTASPDSSSVQLKAGRCKVTLRNGVVADTVVFTSMHRETMYSFTCCWHSYTREGRVVGAFCDHAYDIMKQVMEDERE